MTTLRAKPLTSSSSTEASFDVRTTLGSLSEATSAPLGRRENSRTASNLYLSDPSPTAGPRSRRLLCGPPQSGFALGMDCFHRCFMPLSLAPLLRSSSRVGRERAVGSGRAGFPLQHLFASTRGTRRRRVCFAGLPLFVISFCALSRGLRRFSLGRWLQGDTSAPCLAQPDSDCLLR